MPKVSVIMPCYNDGRYILEAIESVERCPKGLYELIIIDDGSDDAETISVLDELRDGGYTVIDVPHGGPCKARNAAIRESRGEYFLPLDADNILEPQYMSAGSDFLDSKPKYGVYYGDCMHFNEESSHRECIGEFERDRMVTGNYIDTCALIKKRVWEDTGGYDEELFGWEDWEFWINAYQLGWKLKYVPKVMFHYRLKEDSLHIKCGDPGILQGIKDHVMKKHISFFIRNV